MSNDSHARYQVRQLPNTDRFFVVDMHRAHPDTPTAHLIVSRGSESLMRQTADELNTGRIELVCGQELDAND